MGLINLSEKMKFLEGFIVDEQEDYSIVPHKGWFKGYREDLDLDKDKDWVTRLLFNVKDVDEIDGIFKTIEYAKERRRVLLNHKIDHYQRTVAVYKEILKEDPTEVHEGWTTSIYLDHKEKS